MHGYTDFLSVDIRVSYRWFPRNRVGAFILRSEASIAIRSWRGSRVKEKEGGLRQEKTPLVPEGEDADDDFQV